MSVPQRVRETLEQLGPTYVKIGQIMAGRADVLPPAFLDELARLWDQAPPEPAGDIVAVVEGELGKPLTEAFPEFDLVPVAAASLAQVHRARLPDGQEVAVKVQRPHIREQMRADLDILRDQARFLEGRLAMARERRLVELVDEVSFSLLSELDFSLEGRNAQRLRENLRRLPFALVPRVHPEVTTGRLLVTDYLDGIKLTDQAGLAAAGYDLPAVARLGVEMYVQMIFEDGFYHADPHQGNIIVVGEQVALVDFGTVGYLTPELREDLAAMLLAFVQQDPHRMATVMMGMGAVQEYDRLDGLEQALRRLLLRFHGVELRNLALGDILTDVFETARQFNIRIPSELATLAKTLIILDGLARRLDPSFALVDSIRPHVERLARERYRPTQLAREALDLAEQTRHLLRTLPHRGEILLERLERGQMVFGLDIRRLGELSRRLNEVGNRLSFAVVVAGLLLASSIMLSAGPDVAILSVPLLNLRVPIGMLTFLAAGVFGFWLLISIVRSGRP